MIKRNFFHLLIHCIKYARKAILSRLCVAPKSRKGKFAGNFGMHYTSMLLFKGIYQWCLKNHARHLYAVTEHKIYKLLCLRGLPCNLIGDPYVMPDGVTAVAFKIDLRVWETKHMPKSPTLLNWFCLL